jgi:hypothetical protein
VEELIEFTTGFLFVHDISVKLLSFPQAPLIYDKPQPCVLLSIRVVMGRQKTADTLTKVAVSLHKHNMYQIQLSDEMMADLWQLREYYGRGAIVSQVREAVDRYLHEEKEKLGYSAKEFQEVAEDSR